MGHQHLQLQAALLGWYRQHQRRLPWRRDRDPYRVWVSEIMLQQTRVAAVLEHYREFLQAFPTLEALAAATESEVLARWSGLGYYRRARMLHRAAMEVVRERGGVIPQQAEQLRQLPGVGRYTAAAISSIAFGEPAAVVDGNVERVLNRLDGRRRSNAELWQRAEELLDPSYAGEWNQAMMELGAVVCTPKAPRCLMCPLRSWCLSPQQAKGGLTGDPGVAPGAETGTPQPKRRRIAMSRALIVRGGKLFLIQCANDATKMAGMWELPECGDNAGKQLCRVRHSITDTDYEVRVAAARLNQLGAEARRAGEWVGVGDLAARPLTGLTRKILRKLNVSVQSER